MKAIWNNTVLAESENTVIVEGNHYFPPDAINRQYFSDSEKHSHCPWKGDAHYYHIEVDGKQNPDAAWYYPEPKEAAKEIEQHIAFWRGVQVTD